MASLLLCFLLALGYFSFPCWGSLLPEEAHSLSPRAIGDLCLVTSQRSEYSSLVESTTAKAPNQLLSREIVCGLWVESIFSSPVSRVAIQSQVTFHPGIR
jgi:hypothetical protein